MVLQRTISPRELITTCDSDAILQLFAETLRLAEAATSQVSRTSIIMPGPFWLLAHQDPSLAELQASWNGVMPQDWPPWFERNRESLLSDPLREALLHCLCNGQQQGIESGRDLCRVMGAVAQTLNSTNIALVRRNRELAERWKPRAGSQNEWSSQEIFVSRRPDEHGGYISAGSVSLWMASHIGPDYADKLENQDAVYAMQCGDSLVFALADGVSTSLGSRFAAALAAFWFCQQVSELSQRLRLTPEMLMEAARRTQKAMDEELDRLLADPSSADMGEVMRTSLFQSKTAEVVLENTRTAEKPFLQPALATTLIGGFLQPATRAGEFSGAVICIGDGAVEKIGVDGDVDQVIATDPAVTEISSSMGPGPLSREALQGAGIELRPIVLNPGEYLLVSSDGLARGHSESIWSKISELMGDVRPWFQCSRSTAGADLLGELAAVAEKSHDVASLFDDNVSLILLTAG